MKFFTLFCIFILSMSIDSAIAGGKGNVSGRDNLVAGFIPEAKPEKAECYQNEKSSEYLSPGQTYYSGGGGNLMVIACNCIGIGFGRGGLSTVSDSPMVLKTSGFEMKHCPPYSDEYIERRKLK